MFAQHGRYLDGENPLQESDKEEEYRPKLLAKCKGQVARLGLKEAGGKVPNRRTETIYKARKADESS
jgi:hypothetical protein